MSKRQDIKITFGDVAGIIWAVIKEYLKTLANKPSDPDPEPEPKPGKYVTIAIRDDTIKIDGYRVTKIGN